MTSLSPANAALLTLLLTRLISGSLGGPVPVCWGRRKVWQGCWAVSVWHGLVCTLSAICPPPRWLPGGSASAWVPQGDSTLQFRGNSRPLVTCPPRLPLPVYPGIFPCWLPPVGRPPSVQVPSKSVGGPQSTCLFPLRETAVPRARRRRIPTACFPLPHLVPGEFTAKSLHLHHSF